MKSPLSEFKHEFFGLPSIFVVEESGSSVVMGSVTIVVVVTVEEAGISPVEGSVTGSVVVELISGILNF